MIYTGKCEVRPDRLEAFLLVAKELKVSDVDDWNVDKHGVVTGTIEEEVEDGECVEFASDKSLSHLDEQQVTNKRRKTKRKKITNTNNTNKLTGSETGFHNVKKVKSNSQASEQIVKRRHIGKNQESRARPPSLVSL